MLLPKNHFIFLGVLIILLDLGCNIAPKPKNEKSYVFENANIIQLNEEKILEKQSVLIEDGIIIQIESSSSFKNPEGATVVDASGKYLIPSLTDLHVHLEGQAWNIIYPPGEEYAAGEINYEDILFPYIANGITTINVMSAFPEHVAIRDSIRKGKLLGPQMILSRIIDGAGQAWPPPISTWINNPQEAKQAVINAYETGYDNIKVYSFLDKVSYDTIIQTAQKLKMPVIGHIPLSTSIEHLAKSGQTMIAHSEEILKFAKDFSEEEIKIHSKVLVDNNIWVTATLITTQNITNLLNNSKQELNKPGTEYLHPQTRDVWNYIYENLYKPIPETHQEFIKNEFSEFQIPFIYEFQKQGGNILAGTDALIPPNLPGSSLHDELELLVKAGLSPMEALKTATINADKFLGKSNEAQIIKAGNIANLIMLDKNPIENISNTKSISGVFTQNQWISKEEIDTKMEQLAQSFDELKKL